MPCCYKAKYNDTMIDYIDHYTDAIPTFFSIFSLLPCIIGVQSEVNPIRMQHMLFVPLTSHPAIYISGKLYVLSLLQCMPR